MAFARYWIASIVWPCLPISIPRSRPLQVTRISSSALLHLDRAVGADLARDPANELAHECGLLALVALPERRRRRGGRRSSSTVATTRAGS